jgi:gliding motility-associated-like protein
VSLFIHDTFAVHIITPDTAICKEDSVHILVSGDDSLIYSWTPITNINNSFIKEPTVNPPVTTDYVVCANLPNSGCASKCDTIKITINEPPKVLIGNDTIVCKDMAVFYQTSITPNQQYTYLWSGTGSGYLSATNKDTATGFFNQLGNFQLILHVEPQALGCAGDDTANVLVIPNDITLHNSDTIICHGDQVQINVTGHPLFTYAWTPATYLNNPAIDNPISIPDTSIKYTITATFPGCIPMVKSFNIEVQPIPVISAGIDREMCDHDTLQLHATVLPTWYTNYAYSWSPANDLNNGTVADPVFSGHQNVILDLIVTTPIGCSDTDNVALTVHSTEFAIITPDVITICPRDTVFYSANGGVSYYWTPSTFLSDTFGNSPYSVPNKPVEYEVYSTSIFGCVDTDIVRIAVASDAVLDAGEDVTLYPGETAPLNPSGNCSFFTWYPDYHLTNYQIQNPIASPPVTTKYYLTGITEFGCKILDSLTIRISDESILDLPNAFSPGSGTSINDGLKIIKRGLSTLNYFRVFNRWGELVFQTTNIEEGWDGKYKGTVQPMGTYVYVIDAVTSTGKRFYKQGNVTLIR